MELVKRFGISIMSFPLMWMGHRYNNNLMIVVGCAAFGFNALVYVIVSAGENYS